MRRAEEVQDDDGLSDDWMRSPSSRSSGTAAGTRGLTRLEGDLVMRTGRYRQVVVDPGDVSSSLILLPGDLNS